MGMCSSLVMPEAGGGIMLEETTGLGSPRLFTPLGSLGSLGSSGSHDDRPNSPSPTGFAPVLDPRDTFVVGPPLAPPPTSFGSAHSHTTDGSNGSINSMVRTQHTHTHTLT
jgi:hypothetical protein